MRILFYILIFFMFSCEEELGVQEYQEAFNYYDYVAYGWGEYKKQNYQKAIDWFNQSLTVGDVDQDGQIDNAHHSAYVGLAWSKTQLINNIDFSSEQERVEALKYLLYYKNDDVWNKEIDNNICQSGTWESGDCIAEIYCDEDEDCSITDSDNVAEQIYDINDNNSGAVFCLQDYCCSDCFIKDKKISLFYYYLTKFNDFVNVNNFLTAELFFNEILEIGNDIICSSGKIEERNCVVDETYDFNNGKPNLDLEYNISLNYENLVIAVGNLFIEMAEFSELGLLTNNNNQADYYCDAAAILSQTEQCANASCELDDSGYCGDDPTCRFKILTTCTENFDN